MANGNRRIFDLSLWTIGKFFLVVLCLFFLYVIKEVVAILFVALIFASAVDSWVDRLERFRFPRWASILLIYLVVLAVVFFVIYLVIPPLVNQLGQLAGDFPQYFERISSGFTHLKDFSAQHGLLDDFDRGIMAFRDNLSGVVGSVFGAVSDIFGGIVSFIIVLVLTFYMTVEESAIKRTVTFIFPRRHHALALQMINKIQIKIGAWLKGQLVLCLIVGIMAYIGLSILGVKYALVLALIAAVAEFVPYVGPVVAAIPAILLAFVQSPLKALLVLIIYIIIQQLENNILVPKVMQKAVGLNPIVSIVALLIGAKLAGLVGMILAIPVATALMVVVQEFWQAKEREGALEESS